MSIIVAKNLSKIYPVAIKEPGIKGTLRHFIRRNYQYVKAVEDITFEIDPGR